MQKIDHTVNIQIKKKPLYRKCNMSGKLKLKPNLSKIDSKKSVKC